MKSKKTTYLAITLLAIVSIYGAFLLNKKERLLREVGKYTIGVIEKLEVGSKGIRVFLTYSYETQKIDSDFMAEYKDRSNLKIGRRVLIKFIPPEYDIKYMNVEVNCTVPDSIINIPSNGWTKEWVRIYFPECIK